MTDQQSYIVHKPKGGKAAIGLAFVSFIFGLGAFFNGLPWFFPGCALMATAFIAAIVGLCHGRTFSALVLLAASSKEAFY
jgi:hypothetical protein